MVTGRVKEWFQQLHTNLTFLLWFPSLSKSTSTSNELFVESFQSNTVCYPELCSVCRSRLQNQSSLVLFVIQSYALRNRLIQRGFGCSLAFNELEHCIETKQQPTKGRPNQPEPTDHQETKPTSTKRQQTQRRIGMDSSYPYRSNQPEP